MNQTHLLIGTTSIALPVSTLFASLAEPYTAEALFDCLPSVVYFVKNERAEYVVVNRTLADRCANRGKNYLLGKTAAQVYPQPLGKTYWEQDRRLLSSGRSVVNKLELHLYPTGTTGWCLTNKFPLRAANKKVIGLVGVSEDLHPPEELGEDYERVIAAVNYAQEHLDQKLEIPRLADIAKLSAYKLDQRIRALFRITTGQLLLKLRMDSAAEQLRETDFPVAGIGQSCGYADQSGFTRTFHRTVGLTPAEYRRTHRKA
jgi:AraC-like DNA-binding protein